MKYKVQGRELSGTGRSTGKSRIQKEELAWPFTGTEQNAQGRGGQGQGELGEISSCYVIKGFEFLGQSLNLFLRVVDSY